MKKYERLRKVSKWLAKHWRRNSRWCLGSWGEGLPSVSGWKLPYLIYWWDGDNFMGISVFWGIDPKTWDAIEFFFGPEELE